MVVSADFIEKNGKETNLEMRNPSWQEVEQAIKRLDGKTRTEVTISANGDDVFMAIAGGKQGCYYVGVRTQDEKNFALVGPEDLKGEMLMIAGGQEVRYPKRFLTDIDTAIRAAKEYYFQNRCDQNLKWMED